MLIGDPVAFTPGFGPHAEVSVDPPLELLLAAAVELPPAADDAAAELLLLLLLPQPARTVIKAIAATSAKPSRARGTTYLVLTDLLLSSMVNPPRDPPGSRAY
jgi:hypothetical protein